jgi:TIR domain
VAALLGRARREREKASAALAQEQGKREAERQAEEQARRQGDEQDRREEKVERKIITVVDENVQFTVYRPNAVQPEVWYPLLAFAHLAERRPEAPSWQPDPLEQVQALAKQVLGDDAAYGARQVDARGGVPREGQLTFVPLVEGVDFDPRSQTFEWQEDVHQQNFRLMARAYAEGRVLRGQLTVYLGAFILADIDLRFRVNIAAPPPPTLASSSASPTSSQPELTPATANPYDKIFVSYSHKDREIVRQFEAYGKALGNDYLRDQLALRSGEEWDVRLLQLIDKANIFQLFWSSNSMRSEYVRREWEHALALGRPAFIRPTYWEVPMPRSSNPRLPPDELAKLHFHGFYRESDDGPVITPTTLPEYMRVALGSPAPGIRESAVTELAALLDRAEPGLALTAREALKGVAENDVPRGRPRRTDGPGRRTRPGRRAGPPARRETGPPAG